MAIPAARIGLPNFDQDATKPNAPFVENAAMHDDAFPDGTFTGFCMSSGSVVV